MSAPARVLSIGSVPPEWGGPRRGGVATANAALASALAPGRDAAAEIVAVAAPRLGGEATKAAPVPVLGPEAGERPRAFVDRVLGLTRPDVVLLHHVDHAAALSVGRVDREVPRVGYVHSWHAITFAAPEREAGARARTQEGLDGLAGTVVPSAHARREGEALGLTLPRRVEAIPYPLAEAFASAPVGAGERQGVVYVGNFESRKRPDLLIAAAALLPGLRVTLIGDSARHPDLDALIAERDLADRVRLVAHDPATDLPALVAGADVLCVPSESESFGIVYIEALAMGTPVVGFAPPLAEMAAALGRPVGEGLEPGASPEDLAAALARVRAATWDRPALAAAARHEFSLERIARQHAELLADVARPRPSMSRVGPSVASVADLRIAAVLGSALTASFADRCTLLGDGEAQERTHFGLVEVGRDSPADPDRVGDLRERLAGGETPLVLWFTGEAADLARLDALTRFAPERVVVADEALLREVQGRFGVLRTCFLPDCAPGPAHAAPRPEAELVAYAGPWPRDASVARLVERALGAVAAERRAVFTPRAAAVPGALRESVRDAGELDWAEVGLTFAVDGDAPSRGRLPRALFAALAGGAAVACPPNRAVETAFAEVVPILRGDGDADLVAGLAEDAGRRVELAAGGQAVVAGAHLPEHRLASLASLFGLHLVPRAA